jgi:superfamily I DNA/RNA helicase
MTPATLDIAYRLVISDAFARDQQRFAAQKDVLADLALTIAELARQPIHNPKLETHRVNGAQRGVMTSYVGSQQHRVIWFRAGRTAVLLAFDRHDEAYRRARRLSVDYAEDVGDVRVLEEQSAVSGSPAVEAPGPAAPAEAAPFDPWDELLLRSVGLQEHEINMARDVRDDEGVMALSRYLPPERFELLLGIATAESEQAVRDLAQPIAVDDRTAEEERFGEDVEERVVAPEARDFVVVDPDDVDAIFSRPIEEWMVFLHPDQRKLVERTFSGPARVSGGAGTGKTVVGVHRAARLAAEGRKVLFTTYIRTLPGVLETLYAKLSPDTTDNVRFAGIHSYALGLAKTRGAVVDPNAASSAFESAWKRVAGKASPLHRLGLAKPYFRDEIAWVIKGRGLGVDDVDAYLDAPRTGRGTAFSREVRFEIWKLYAAYERALRAKHVVDFDDVLTLARDVVREDGEPNGYDAVVVDEAQDLTRVGLELVAAIGGDRADGLLLLGDGQQSLYPGGHSLGAVGIDVRGRASVLRLNYRNTRQIVEAADRIVAGLPFDDGDEELETTDPADRIEALRDGPRPAVNRYESVDDHDAELAIHIQDLASRGGTDLGDIAVLVPTNPMVREVERRVGELGLECQRLDKYDGRPSSRVKVGTFKRAKGLEFKHVLIPRLEPANMRDEPQKGEDHATCEERLARTRRELFVAMTRARDSVWIGHVGEPSALLGQA